MVEIVEQLCVKSLEITAKNGDCCRLQQGKKYTTSVPDDSDKIVVFTNYWVSAPKTHFVLSE